MSDLERQFGKVTATIHARANALLMALTIEGDSRLRAKTPVDTGHARGNWNVAVDTPDDSVVPLGHPPLVPAIEAGDVVYLTNAVPYIEPLEYGHSKQAPGGMVRLTAAELVPLVEQMVAQLESGRGV